MVFPPKRVDVTQTESSLKFEGQCCTAQHAQDYEPMAPLCMKELFVINK